MEANLLNLVHEFEYHSAVHLCHNSVFQSNFDHQIPVEPVSEYQVVYGSTDEEVCESTIII